MQCGGPVASPGSAMSTRLEMKQEVIYGKSHRVLHTQQLPQEGRTSASGATWESHRVRVVEKKISLSREVIVRLESSEAALSTAMPGSDFLFEGMTPLPHGSRYIK